MPQPMSNTNPIARATSASDSGLAVAERTKTPSPWDAAHEEFFQQGDEGNYDGGPASVAPEGLEELFVTEQLRVFRTPEQDARRARALRFVVAFVVVQAVVLVIALMRNQHRATASIDPVAVVIQASTLDEREVAPRPAISARRGTVHLDSTITAIPTSSGRAPAPKVRGSSRLPGAASQIGTRTASSQASASPVPIAASSSAPSPVSGPAPSSAAAAVLESATMAPAELVPAGKSALASDPTSASSPDPRAVPEPDQTPAPNNPPTAAFEPIGDLVQAAATH